MLLPRTHAWTRRQKWLIVASAVVGLATCGALVYGYEHYYRGPGQEVLYGTWQFDGVFYVEFRHDHTFSMFELDEPHSLITKGRWYAGGKFLYIGYPLSFRVWGNTLDVWRIEDISREQVSVRYCQDCMEHVFQRVDSAITRASNHAMERTGTRCGPTLALASTLPLQATRALGARRSSCSR